MVEINRHERDAIIEKYPGVHIVGTMKQRSGRGHYSQVFPYEYVPDTIVHGQTFICCDVDIQRVECKTFLRPTLYIWVFTHKSKMRLPEGGVRVDKLCAEIAKKINGSRYYGLGELEFMSSRRFAPITDYQGKVLTFQARDFNRLSPSGRSAPSNRRSG